MTRWLEKRENWIPGTGRGRSAKKKVEKVYSISEVAQLFSVSRTTVFKWLSLDEPNDAVIPPEAWFKLPRGHIRIREWIILQLQAADI